MSAKPIPRQGGFVFDEKRNTSRVFPVPAGAHRDALRALHGLDPALRRWITEGHPRLTESEHVARFGEPYRVTRKKA